VRKIVPDFKFSPKEWTRGYKIGEWINEMKQDIKNKTKITTKLMKENIWDFMMVHFMETDQVQHFMWDQKQNDNNQSILEIYQSLDHTIAKIQAELSQEDTLFIMSDHGFGSLSYNFHIDTWLLKEGYIKLKNNLSSLLKKISFKMGITKETLYPVGEYIYPWLRKEGILETALDVVSNPWLQRLFLASQNVNWSQSQAYSHSEIGSIYLNVKGREPRGCIEPGNIDQVREEIIGKLKELENPFTGKKISTQVYKGEEVYHGSQSIYAPDIVFLPDDMEILGKGAYQFLSHKIVSKSESQSGHHRMDGIFLAQGPGINQGHKITGSHIMDMAPTILYQLGLPILDHMDGTVINDIYEEELEEEIEQVSKSDLGLKTKKRNSDGESEDDEDKKKRLKGLGYVS
jgi:predicted AlkP superfamily phosphohydrolase/phosphomutase